jgi:hypothetical protein
VCPSLVMVGSCGEDNSCFFVTNIRLLEDDLGFNLPGGTLTVSRTQVLEQALDGVSTG